MNQSESGLSPGQFSKIVLVLDDLDAMKLVLGRDAERGSRELSENPSDQFLRRNLVRIFGALVEGHSFLLKQVVLKLHEPLQHQLSFDDIARLTEKKLDSIGQPKLDKQGKPIRWFLPFFDNCKFAADVFRRTCGGAYVISYSGVGYEAFRITIAIRDRLMHPKKLDDLEVKDAEVMDLQAAWTWYQTEMVALLTDSHVALNTRFAGLAQSMRPKA